MIRVGKYTVPVQVDTVYLEVCQHLEDATKVVIHFMLHEGMPGVIRLAAGQVTATRNAGPTNANNLMATIGREGAVKVCLLRQPSIGSRLVPAKDVNVKHARGDQPPHPLNGGVPDGLNATHEVVCWVELANPMGV